MTEEKGSFEGIAAIVVVHILLFGSERVVVVAVCLIVGDCGKTALGLAEAVRKDSVLVIVVE